jgi:hypothetical protein
MSTNKFQYEKETHSRIRRAANRLVAQIRHTAQGRLVVRARPVGYTWYRLIRYIPDTKVRVAVVRLVAGEKVVRDGAGGIRKVKVEILIAAEFARLNSFPGTESNKIARILFRLSPRAPTYRGTSQFVLKCLSPTDYQPFSESGHKSVTLITMDLTTFGKNGGLEVYVFNRVKLKHLPHEGPTLHFVCGAEEGRITRTKGST